VDLQNASEKIDYALAKIERQLGETAWLAGETYTLADINFYAHCGAMVHRMFPEKDVDAMYPRLAEWRERVTARPAVAEALKSEDRTQPGLRTWSGDR
jgi:glutathione S-transferase